MSAAINWPNGLADAAKPPECRGIDRDAVRLLVTDRARRNHVHGRFLELPSFLSDGDLLVVNDSATLPAALSAQRANGESVLLHVATMVDRRLWVTEPRAAVVRGEEFCLPGGGSVVMIAPVEPEHPRLWYGWFALPVPMYAYLAAHGQPIRYGYVNERFPLRDYQTMFAREPGSAEMPSAARPFTPRVVNALHHRGIDIAKITLHCAVASLETPEHPPLERYAVAHEAADAVNRARSQRRRVIAVGTTVVRALESAVRQTEVVASAGWTDLVIDERHEMRIVDGLLTGFHAAAATHQWIMRAFLCADLLASAYAEAAEKAYHRHEFGDVHLIL